MSGTILLLNKNSNHFGEITGRVERQTQKLFSQFFDIITAKKRNKNELLIELKQDGKEYFYEDKSGNWLSYEGIVFELNNTRMCNAEELLNAYKKLGEYKFANSLDGHFVIKIYDSLEQKYLIINDFIKNKTNFICETDDLIMFTPFLNTVGLIRDTELDTHSFNEFMWRYYILSERTMLKNVQRLSPASIYTITIDKILKKSYWDWPHQYTDLTFNECVERMVSSMQETARLINYSLGKPCIDFTMGQDSRQIVSAFTNQNLPFVTATFGKKNFYEVKKIGEIADRHHIENHSIELQDNYQENIWEYFKNAITLGSCEEPGYMLGRILYMRGQYTQYGNASINGMDGHFYKNGLWDEFYSFNLYREPKKFKIDMFLKLRALSKNYPEEIFKNDFLSIKNNSSQYFSHIVEKAINNYLDSPVSMQVDRFDLYHWLNFAITANSSANTLYTSLSPLLLRRNLELALQIPVKWKFNLSKFQRAVVYKLDPLLAKERTDFGGVTMTPKNIFTYIPFYFRYFYHQSGRFRNKIKIKLGLNVVTHLHEAWDYLPIYKKIFENVDFKESIKYKNMHLSAIITEDKWNSFLKKFKNKDFQTIDNYEFLFKIASVEYFLRSTHGLKEIV